MVSSRPDDHDFLIRWLASYPKSGNTWVRLFFQAYRHGTADMNRMGNLSDSCRAAWQGSTVHPLENLTEGMRIILRPAAMFNLQCIISAVPVDRPLVKTHSANVCCADIAQIPLPITYGAVHLIRDPRDLAVSWAHHFGVSYDQAIASISDPGNALAPNGTLQVATDWSRHTDSWQHAYNTKTWRYEDLLDDPHTHFAQMLAHVGDRVDSERVNEAVTMCDIATMQKDEADKGFIEAKEDRFFRKGQKGQWRTELTRTQTKAIKDAHGAKMREWGYL